jgi:MoaA/NifB/PqqE/SkfB family radical SAM enzyme
MTLKKSHALNVKDKLTQASVQAYIKGIDWNTTSSAPFVVEFDPTTNCNLACPDCISGSLLNQGQIDRIRVKTLVREMIDAGVRAVILIGGGEPMMHPDAGWMIREFGEAGVKIGITTNGLYLKKHLDETARHASWVRVSMDAGTSETFNRIRPSRTGNSLFQAAVDNMRAYAKIKTGTLGYSFMVFSEGNYGFKGVALSTEKVRNLSHITTNAHEIFVAAKLARDIGCNYFEVKPMYDVNHFSVMQKDVIADMVEEQIDYAKSLETENFRIIEAVKLRATLRGESNLEPKPYHRCAVAHMRTLVTPSGVYVCPYFRGDKLRMVGDIATTSFLDMWNGAQRAHIMEHLDPSVDCPMHCIRHESNLFIENVIDNGFSTSMDDYDLFI